MSGQATFLKNTEELYKKSFREVIEALGVQNVLPALGVKVEAVQTVTIEDIEKLITSDSLNQPFGELLVAGNTDAWKVVNNMPTKRAEIFFHKELGSTASYSETLAEDFIWKIVLEAEKRGTSDKIAEVIIIDIQEGKTQKNEFLRNKTRFARDFLILKMVRATLVAEGISDQKKKEEYLVAQIEPIFTNMVTFFKKFSKDDHTTGHLLVMACGARSPVEIVSQSIE